MSKFDNCDACETSLYDADAQKILCRDCDGENKFREITLDSIDTFADALEIKDNWCQACCDRNNDNLPPSYEGLDFCPLCGTPWSNIIEVEDCISEPVA